MDDLRERVKRAAEAIPGIDRIGTGLKRNWILTLDMLPDWLEKTCHGCARTIESGEEYYQADRHDDTRKMSRPICYKCAAPLVGVTKFNPVPKAWFNNRRA